MFRRALKYLVEDVSMPTVEKINGETYSDRPLHRIKHNPKATCICLNTLSGLVDYIKSGFDSRDKIFVQVESPTNVIVFSALDKDREREYMVEAHAHIPVFRFNEYIDREEFCANVRSKFVDNPRRAMVLTLVDTIKAASLDSNGEALVLNNVMLPAYRTFVEVEQPEQQFIFRMRQNSAGGVLCGLFEADGGAWKLEAMEAVRMYLVEHLEGVKGLTVIS